MRARLWPHSVLDQTLIITRSNSSNANVRSVCPIWHPFHVSNQRRSMQSRNCHCSVFGQQNSAWAWDCDLILHLTPIKPSNLITQTYILLVQDEHKTRPIYSPNEDQRRAVTVVYFNSTRWGWEWNYDLILHWSPITRIEFRRACTQTYPLFDQDQRNATTFHHIFIWDQHRAVIVIIAEYLDSTWTGKITTLYSIDHQQQL